MPNKPLSVLKFPKEVEIDVVTKLEAGSQGEYCDTQFLVRGEDESDICVLLTVAELERLKSCERFVVDYPAHEAISAHEQSKILAQRAELAHVESEIKRAEARLKEVNRELQRAYQRSEPREPVV